MGHPGRQAMTDGYESGVPCWVETWQADAEAAARFYTGLFGWDTERVEAPASTYFMCRLDGRDVAGIGSSEALSEPAAWTTFVWVESVEETVARVVETGGRVVREPFESLDGGRMAIVADPEGAVLGAWCPGKHRGAQLVNEPGAWAWSQLQAGDLDRAVASTAPCSAGGPGPSTRATVMPSRSGPCRATWAGDRPSHCRATSSPAWFRCRTMEAPRGGGSSSGSRTSTRPQHGPSSWAGRWSSPRRTPRSGGARCSGIRAAP